MWPLSLFFILPVAQGLGKYKHLIADNNSDHSSNPDSKSVGGEDTVVSIETLAAALIIGIFAVFIVVYTVCLQCCWGYHRCPWFLDNAGSAGEDKDKYTSSNFCPCVQSVASPDS